MKRPARIRAARGFTLIEILVAMLILGIMTALGYGAYRAARISAERTEESLQRSKEIEYGMRVLVQDLSQAAPRPVRDILSEGEPTQPAFRGTTGAGTVKNPSTSGSGTSLISSSPDLLASSKSNFGAGSSNSGFAGGGDTTISSILDVSRMGWSNTAGQQRGTLQRVSYALVKDVLKRGYQINMDVVQGSKPVIQDLMTGVNGIQFRYLDANQAWQSQWPAASGGTSGNNTLQLRPVAVEVVIEFKDWGRIRRVVEVAG